MKKRIAMVCHWESPYKEEWKGGMGVYMDGLSRKLSEKDYNIDFYVPKVEDYPTEQEVSPGVKIIRLSTAGVQTEDVDTRNMQHMQAFGDELLEYVGDRRLTYDVVHAQYWSSHPASAMLARELGKPLVLQLHQLQLLKEISFERNGLRFSPDPDRVAFEKQSIEQSDRVVLVSNQQLYDLERDYFKGELPFDIRRKIAVVRNAIETEKYNFVTEEERAELKKLRGINPDSTVIGCHGRIDEDKAVDRLVYATHLLRRDNPESLIDLSIVGRGSELARLEHLVDDLEMPGVHFYGYKTGEDLAEFVRMVDIGVIPSVYETFGLSVAELMAFGIPTVVCKGSGGPEEVTGKVDPLVPPVSSIEGLKTTLQKYLLDPQLRTEHGTKMRQRCVEKFNWNRLIDEMVQLYSELIV